MSHSLSIPNLINLFAPKGHKLGKIFFPKVKTVKNSRMRARYT